MCLALDVRLAGLPLCIERIEFEVEVMLGGFARVDRTPHTFRSGLIIVAPFSGPEGRDPLLRRRSEEHQETGLRSLPARCRHPAFR
jgi:hypothetical protein